MNLQKVTITGADDSVQPEDLLKLTNKYPFVEWGILVSNSNFGQRRFPSWNWLNELVELKIDNPQISLSMHLCGKFVRDFCQGETLSFKSLMQNILPWFDRIQLNFHAQRHQIQERSFIYSLRQIKHVQYIFQLDEVNHDLMKVALLADVNAVGLIDLSHGAGVLPDSWPLTPKGIYQGFAGGLGPKNLEVQLPKITLSSNGNPFWIDMETRVRSDDDRTFVLSKVERCLSICAQAMEAKLLKTDD